MHLPFRLTARTVRAELALANLVQDRFRHDRTRRIAGAQKEHVLRLRHCSRSFSGNRIGPYNRCSVIGSIGNPRLKAAALSFFVRGIAARLHPPAATREISAQLGNHLSPKIAVPTRTCVAPNSMAIRKSALIPIDRRASPLRRAILAVSAKCGAGGSSAGGMHISPPMASA